MTPMLPTLSPTELPLTSPDHPALALLPEVPTRDQIEALGQLLLALESEHARPDVPTAHYVVGEVYGRSVSIPAGTVLVGLPHRHDHLCVVVGDITVWTEQGRQRFTGAQIVPARAGAMRAGFAHTDTTWLSVHATPVGCTSVEDIEDALVEGADRLMTRRGVLQ